MKRRHPFVNNIKSGQFVYKLCDFFIKTSKNIQKIRKNCYITIDKLFIYDIMKYKIE